MRLGSDRRNSPAISSEGSFTRGLGICTYTKKYDHDSTGGLHLRMRYKENVAIVEVCVVGSIEMVEGQSNGSIRNITSGPKGAGNGSRMIQGKEKNFLVGGQRGIDWYEV